MAEEPGFVDDVKQAARAWRGSWLVPGIYLLTAVLAALVIALMPEPPHECARKVLNRCPVPVDQELPSLLFSLAGLPLSIFYIGLVGCARLWYFRRFQGGDLSASEVWWLSWKFFGRFFVLGLLYALVFLPGTIIYIVLLLDGRDWTALTVLLAFTILGDVLLTFVTPGLALYNSSVGAAFSGGVKLLRTTWPQCAAYALVPPLALSLLGRGLGRGHFKPLALVGAVTGPPLTLLFAGATVAFLVRRYPPMSENGSLGYVPPRHIPDLRVPRP